MTPTDPPPSSRIRLSGSHHSSGGSGFGGPGSNGPADGGPVAVPPKTFGPYQLLDELGRGGFGVVYRALHAPSGQHVALKVLLKVDPRARSRFEREAHVTRSLDHPHVARLLDAGLQGGHPYLATELIEGGSLAQRLRRGPLPPLDAARLIAQAALGVEHAHQRGILHRDLKPDNVLLDPQGSPRVVDFGLARLDSGHSSLTQSGAMVGTGPYLPPEQARGQHDHVGPASDVYGLGATLYEALTGRPPFTESTFQQLLVAVVERSPQPPRSLRPEIPARLEAICLRCLEKSPDDRYPSPLALATALQDAVDAPEPPPPRRLLPLVLTLALVAVVGALVWPTPTPPTSEDPPTADDPPPPEATPEVAALPPLQLPTTPPGQPHWEAPGSAPPLRAGPWVLLPSGGSARTTRGDAPVAAPAGVNAPVAWDARRRRVLSAPGGALVGWDPATDATVALAALPFTPVAMVCADDTLVAAGFDGQVVAVDLAETPRVRWESRVDGWAAPPVFLDLSGDDVCDHVLIGTSASRLSLFALEDGRSVAGCLLPSPARFAPLRVGAAVVVACAEGEVLRIQPTPTELRVEAQRDLGVSLMTPPVRFGSSVVVGGNRGWLFAVSEDLAQVVWASRHAGLPTGPLVAVDLDGDGAEELCSAWVEAGASAQATLRVHDPAGRTLLERGCGEGTLTLAPGDALPLIGSGSQAWAWGPWEPFPPPLAPGVEELWMLLEGGAFEAVRARGFTNSDQGQRARALAAWHLGDVRELQVLGSQHGARFEQALRQRIQGVLNTGDIEAARRLADPVGLELNKNPPPAFVQVPTSPLSESIEPWGERSPVVLELRDPRLPARGVRALEIGGAGFREGKARRQGLMLSSTSRFRLQFDLPRAGRVELRLLHWAIPNHVRGYTSYRVAIDRSPLPPRLAPGASGGPQLEAIDLGPLEAGAHVLELAPLPRMWTLHCVNGLELVVRR